MAPATAPAGAQPLCVWGRSSQASSAPATQDFPASKRVLSSPSQMRVAGGASAPIFSNTVYHVQFAVSSVCTKTRDVHKVSMRSASVRHSGGTVLVHVLNGSIPDYDMEWRPAVKHLLSNNYPNEVEFDVNATLKCNGSSVTLDGTWRAGDGIMLASTTALGLVLGPGPNPPLSASICAERSTKAACDVYPSGSCTWCVSQAHSLCFSDSNIPASFGWACEPTSAKFVTDSTDTASAAMSAAASTAASAVTADAILRPADEFNPSAPARFATSVLRGAGRTDGSVRADGYLAIVSNAAPHFRALGPLGGRPCGVRAKTSDTARAHRCRWAVNGGPFSMDTGRCDTGVFIGNGSVLGSGGWNHSMFGATADGDWVVGKLDPTLTRRWRVAWAINGFWGDPWLVRDGVVNVQPGGTHAPRTAVGIDKLGRLMLLEIDGCEPYKGCKKQLGVTKHTTAELLLAHGAQYAINLDGGGSSTTVDNGTVINHPTDSDSWEPSVERTVTNIVCVL